MRTFLALLALLLATAAQAQQRQPANLSTLPQSSPQEFDLLDNQGRWMPFGVGQNGAFSPYGGAGSDLRSFGCVADGVTDQGACVNRAIANAPGCVIVPDTQLGFRIATTVVVTGCLKGQHVATMNTNPNFTYPGASWLKCDVGPNGICVDLGSPNALTQAPQIENVTIGGVAGTPPSGSIGLRVPGGYNLRGKGVAVINFDNCVLVGPGASIAPISVNFFDLTLGRCQSHYFTIDGVPEVKVNGGRFGLNGSGEFNALDFVYFTKTGTLGAGGGPNTVQFDHIQFNPGSAGSGVQCAIRWGGWTGSGGTPGLYWFTNDYFEWHTDHGGTQGIFCSDSTVPTISQLFVVNSVTSNSGTTTPIFSLDPATTPIQWWLSHDLLGGSGATLHTGHPGSQVNGQIHLDNNTFGGGTSIIADDNKSEVFSTGNHYGVLTISGPFGHLSMIGDEWASGYTDTATGNITATATFGQTFTPHLRFNSVEPADIAYGARSGAWSRNAKGGFDVSVSITLTNKGTANAGDLASIAGWPLACASGLEGAPMQSATGFTGLTGAPQAFMSGTAAGISQSTATGIAQIPYSSFTNTTSFSITLRCGKAT